jgi:hypothetical protein
VLRGVPTLAVMASIMTIVAIAGCGASGSRFRPWRVAGVYSVPWRLIAVAGRGIVVSWSGGTCDSQVPVNARLVVREEPRFVRVGVLLSEVASNPCEGVATAGLAYRALQRPLAGRRLVHMKPAITDGAPPPFLEPRVLEALCRNPGHPSAAVHGIASARVLSSDAVVAWASSRSSVCPHILAPA